MHLLGDTGKVKEIAIYANQIPGKMKSGKREIRDLTAAPLTLSLTEPAAAVK